MELDNTQRLAALRATGLLDSPKEEEFDRITRLACRMLAAPVALLFLIDEHGTHVKSQTYLYGEETQRLERSFIHSIGKHVIESEAPLVVHDATDQQTDITAYAGYPLKTDTGDVIGSFCVLDTEERTWTVEDQQCLEDLTAMVMTEIGLRVALDEERRLRQEKDEIARTLQAALLPPILPLIDGVDISTAYLPQGTGTLVGGDFYDIFESADHKSHIVLGDVCGKGFIAARTSLLVRHVLRAATLHGDDSQASFLLVDEALKQQNHPFVATEVVEIEIRDDVLHCEVTIAGQPLPLLVQNGKVKVAGEYGTVLGAGLDTDLRFGSVQCDLAQGDMLIMFTDGVTDNPSDGLTEYQLCELLNTDPPQTTREAVDRLVSFAHNASATERPPVDDIAIVAVGNPA